MLFGHCLVFEQSRPADSPTVSFSFLFRLVPLFLGFLFLFLFVECGYKVNKTCCPLQEVLT